jgi:hypothetical protein
MKLEIIHFPSVGKSVGDSYAFRCPLCRFQTWPDYDKLHTQRMVTGHLIDQHQVIPEIAHGVPFVPFVPYEPEAEAVHTFPPGTRVKVKNAELGLVFLVLPEGYIVEGTWNYYDMGGPVYFRSHTFEEVKV